MTGTGVLRTHERLNSATGTAEGTCMEAVSAPITPSPARRSSSTRIEGVPLQRVRSRHPPGPRHVSHRRPLVPDGICALLGPSHPTLYPQEPTSRNPQSQSHHWRATHGGPARMLQTTSRQHNPRRTTRGTLRKAAETKAATKLERELRAGHKRSRSVRWVGDCPASESAEPPPTGRAPLHTWQTSRAIR